MRPFAAITSLTTHVLHIPAFQSFKDAHFNLTKHFREQLEKPSRLHAKDVEFLTLSALASCGESPWMRQYLDKPSQMMNAAFKKEVMQPASDIFLSARQVWSKDTITTSLELERQRRRHPLRELSMHNVLNSKESRQTIAEGHCAAIAQEGVKILQANLRNMLTKHACPEQDVADVMRMMPSLALEDGKRATIDQFVMSEAQLHRITSVLATKVPDVTMADEAMDLYKQTIAESKSKREGFQTKINDMQQLEDEFGTQRVVAQYAKVRLLYSVEWLARAKCVGVLYDSLLELGDLSFDLTQKDVVDRNIAKSGNELTKLYGKQIITTALGFGINASTRKKDGTKGTYLVACDTELHDYAKFPIRPMLHCLVGITAATMATSMGKEEEAEKLARDVSSILLRFISGSHIGMRMLPQELMNLAQDMSKAAAPTSSSQIDFMDILANNHAYDVDASEPSASVKANPAMVQQLLQKEVSSSITSRF